MSNQQLASENVVLQAPMSFTGATKRIWRITRTKTGAALYAIGTLAVLLIVLAWVAVFAWYVVFGLLLVPYRVVRRGSRRRRMEDLRHREALAAVSVPAEPRSSAVDRVA
jgi:hypothetical protein